MDYLLLGEKNIASSGTGNRPITHYGIILSQKPLMTQNGDWFTQINRINRIIRAVCVFCERSLSLPHDMPCEAVHICLYMYQSKVARAVEAMCAHFAFRQADGFDERLDGVELQRSEV